MSALKQRFFGNVCVCVLRVFLGIKIILLDLLLVGLLQLLLQTVCSTIIAYHYF